MEELSYSELIEWYKQYFNQPMDGSTRIPFDSILSEDRQIKFAEQLTGIIGTEFYKNISPDDMQDQKNTYRYYFAVFNASQEQQLKALYQTIQMEK